MPNAARQNDKTEHNGLVDEGSPNVTINGLPAARFNDYHTCPSDTDGYAHVGGPICEGSATVTINGRMAARLGDGLICAGPSESDSESESEDHASLTHGREKEWGEHEKKSGSNKIDERRGPAKYQKDPLLDFHAEKNWGGDSGTYKEFWGDHGDFLTGEYHAKSQIDAEIRSIKDFRVTLDAIDVGASGSVLEAGTGPGDIGIGTAEAEAKVLHGAIDGKAQIHIDTKKKQGFAGVAGEVGGSVVEGSVSAESKKLRIPFTNWGIGIEGEISGSLLTLKAEGHAGVRFDPKRGFSARAGGKVGALLAGLGFDLGFTIGPMDPPEIPNDKIITGSPNVIIGN